VVTRVAISIRKVLFFTLSIRVISGLLLLIVLLVMTVLSQYNLYLSFSKIVCGVYLFLSVHVSLLATLLCLLTFSLA
jgi:hypothetical protein